MANAPQSNPGSHDARQGDHALLSDYGLGRAYDEMFDGPAVREAYAGIADWLERTPPEERLRKAREAELLFRRIGITFAVYTEGGDPERLIPFDGIPRILDHAAWSHLERGLVQRVGAYVRFGSSIPPALNELAICMAGRKWTVRLRASAFPPPLSRT